MEQIQESAAKHTPGPWTVNGFGGDFRVIARMQPHEVAVSAKAEGGDEISNAVLMAAAPDLLEALRTIERMQRPPSMTDIDFIIALRDVAARALASVQS